MAVYISMGSNMGQRENFLYQAVEMLAGHREINVEAVSSLYETKPVGKADQGWFVNAAARLQCSLSPFDLLRFMQHVEEHLGRRRTERWGPRTVDLDIILYDMLELPFTQLTVPHPRARERAFVLVPLAELEPELAFPWGQSVKKLIDELEYSEQKVLFFKKWDVKL